MQSLVSRINAGKSFTKMPRRYLDELGRGNITLAGYAVLTAVADKTVSWDRPWWLFTVADFQDLTGLSHQGVRNAVEALVSADLLVRKPAGKSYSYALVPRGMTGTEVLALYGVDNPGRGVNSVEGQGSTELGVTADRTYIRPKEGIKEGGPRRGQGVRGAVGCPSCQGTGWVVTVEADGFTESVARCSC